MNGELLQVLDHIEREKGIKREVLIEAVGSALASAARKLVGKTEDVSVKIDPEPGHISVFSGDTEVASKDFQEAIDPVVTFIGERTIGIGSEKTPKPELYSVYCKWSEASGLPPLSARRFNQRLAQHIPNIGQKKIRGTRYWVGLGIQLE